jgi:hypothetical protein
MAFLLPFAIGTPIAIISWNHVAKSISKQVQPAATLKPLPTLIGSLSIIPLYLLIGKGKFLAKFNQQHTGTVQEIRKQTLQLVSGMGVRGACIWYGSAIGAGLVNGYYNSFRE